MKLNFRLDQQQVSKGYSILFASWTICTDLINKTSIKSEIILYWFKQPEFGKTRIESNIQMDP